MNLENVEGDDWKVGYGISSNKIITYDKEIAKELKLLPYLTTTLFIEKEDLLSNLIKRHFEITGNDSRNKNALIVGCGSVGSVIAVNLVRSGIGKITLCDMDYVSKVNLSRTIYVVNDIKDKKVIALKRHLLEINPYVLVQTIDEDIIKLSAETKKNLFSDVDLIIAATDDTRAQFEVNKYSYYHSKPVIFPGCWNKAEISELIMVFPGINSPCYSCLVPYRKILESNKNQNTTHNYENEDGSSRLQGVTALGPDIQIITSITSKVALSILLLETNVPLKEFVEVIIARKLWFLFVSTTQVDMISKFLEQSPGQYSYQSVWATTEKKERVFGL